MGSRQCTVDVAGLAEDLIEGRFHLSIDAIVATDAGDSVNTTRAIWHGTACDKDARTKTGEFVPADSAYASGASSQDGDSTFQIHANNSTAPGLRAYLPDPFRPPTQSSREPSWRFPFRPYGRASAPWMALSRKRVDPDYSK